ncbi:flagellar hook-basal body complex protein [Vagococcus sp. BWB3-3]|uniref:Flagellar hook-basal body complex protein n=1 Tax=Vagococcus allomyrinae TaxID=2794353 RepID=A0A940P9B5_9ENTE|nr:flagellar hook-basal body complex protein [Vagococcus allomyrinae]MBP1042031.1 flagellar hook-basal body complex protein [Vagococcus allomyrinae]
MIRSMDTLQRNLNILQKKQENLSANVANSNTYGYKSKQLLQTTRPAVPMFNHLNGPNLDQRNEIGDFIFGNQLAGVSQNMSQGAMKATSRETDFGLIGDGYFNIRLANGQTAYTRNGNFNLNDGNQLVTQEGYLVIGANGQGITVNQGETLPDFQLTRFNDSTDLTSRGQTVFIGVNGQPDNQTVVQSKYLESSNVDMVDEMTQLIETARQFETNQKALHASDETLRRAVNELGKV